MKKIFKGIKNLLKGIFGNLDYLAAFVVGAAAYKFAPDQLEAAKMALETFDYAGAFDAIKGAVVAIVEWGKATYESFVPAQA